MSRVRTLAPNLAIARQTRTMILACVRKEARR